MSTENNIESSASKMPQALDRHPEFDKEVATTHFDENNKDVGNRWELLAEVMKQNGDNLPEWANWISGVYALEEEPRWNKSKECYETTGRVEKLKNRYCYSDAAFRINRID